MSKKQRRIFWPVLLAISAFATLALVSARTGGVVSAVDRTTALDTKSTSHLPPIAPGVAVPEPPRGEIKRTNLAEVAPQPPNDERVEVEVITVRASGFEPSAITRPQGRFMLAINNHTGLGELSLRLDRVRGNRLHEVRMPKGRIRWNHVFNLPPGDYLLSEENHPEWACRIKMTPQ